MTLNAGLSAKQGRVKRPWLAYLVAMISAGVCGGSVAQVPAPFLKCEGVLEPLEKGKLESLMSQVDRFMMTTSDISKAYSDPAVIDNRHGATIRLALARKMIFRQPWMRVDFQKDILAIKFQLNAPAMTTYLLGSDGDIVTVLGGDKNILTAMFHAYGCRM
jgi:hypothetical protein